MCVKRFLVCGRVVFSQVLLFWVLFSVSAECEDAVPEIDWSCPMYSKLDENQRQLLREYRDSYVKLLGSVDNVTMLVKETRLEFFRQEGHEQVALSEGDDPIIAQKVEWEYRSSGGLYYRVDSNNPSAQDNEILLVTPQDIHFLVKQEPSAKYFSLKGITKRRDKDKMEIEDTISNIVFPIIPFSTSGVKLHYYLFQKPPFADRCVIDNIVVNHQQQSNESVTITTTATGKKNQKVVRYEYVFLRNYQWVVTEINCATDKRIEEIRNEYQHFVKGKIPCLKRSISTTRNPDTKAKYSATEYEITKVIPGPVPLQEFEVSRFLPPGTTVGIKTAVFSWFRIFCIIAGLLLLIVSIYLKIRFARMG
ncbi:MAG: hypothetical protein LBJ00_11720 [Planctomycetaceae bacterium]|jgi:hypothetical protein|nr:hypothetical protein [Planctomycetaceae bacterium]